MERKGWTEGVERDRERGIERGVEIQGWRESGWRKRDGERGGNRDRDQGIEVGDGERE